MKFVQRLLESVGVEPERCQMFTMSAADSPKFVAAAKKMHQVIGGLPPLERSAGTAPSHAGSADVTATSPRDRRPPLGFRRNGGLRWR